MSINNREQALEDTVRKLCRQRDDARALAGHLEREIRYWMDENQALQEENAVLRHQRDDLLKDNDELQAALFIAQLHNEQGDK